jgi:hypothetical protein
LAGSIKMSLQGLSTYKFDTRAVLIYLL